jgi:hypothetical protein
MSSSHGDTAPRISGSCCDAATSFRAPSWCGLPVPGVWALVISSPTMQPVSFKIDEKRMYTIAADGDIEVADLPHGARVRIFHHKSDGQVYVSADGPLVCRLADGILASAEPVLFSSDVLIGDCRIELLKQAKISLRETLRNRHIEDDTTNRNTILNSAGFMKRKSTVPGVTPLSGYRQRRKKCKMEPDDHKYEGNKTKSVRFIDFSSI